MNIPPISFYALVFHVDAMRNCQFKEWRTIMKKETIPTPQQNNTDEGFPLSATIMLGAIVLAVVALILKVIGLF